MRPAARAGRHLTRGERVGADVGEGLRATRTAGAGADVGGWSGLDDEPGCGQFGGAHLRIRQDDRPPGRDDEGGPGVGEEAGLCGGQLTEQRRDDEGDPAVVARDRSRHRRPNGSRGAGGCSKVALLQSDWSRATLLQSRLP